MANEVIKISELPESSDYGNLHTIGTHTDGQGNVSSKKVPLANLAAVSNKADNDAVVHKTGDETISGAKTFGTIKVFTIANTTDEEETEDYDININPGGASVVISGDTSINDNLHSSGDKAYYGAPRVPDNEIAVKGDFADYRTKDQQDAVDATKANKDGYYETLGAGYAKSMLGMGIATPEEFTFGRTGENLDIATGVATFKRLKGKTIVWNQLIIRSGGPRSTVYGITREDVLGDSTKVRVFGTSTQSTSFTIINGVTLPVGHKVFCHLGISSLPSGTGLNNYNGIVSNIVTLTSTILGYGISIAAGTTVDLILRPWCVDLTQMFGAGNEPSTPEEFEAMFPLPYYPYNAGELISFKGESIKTNGLNQWDEEYELGTIGSDGVERPSNLNLRSKNYTPVFPSTAYYAKCSDIYICYYDVDKTFISREQHNNQQFTTPSNCAFIKIATGTSYGVVYNHDICIHISYADTTRNGVYEPYEKHTLPLNITTLTGKVNGQGTSETIFADGMKSAGSVYDELIAVNGMFTKAIKRIGVVDLGSLNWEKSGANWLSKGLSSSAKAPLSNLIVGNILASAWTADDATGALPDKSVAINTASWIFIKDAAFDDITPAAFKAAMSGVLLYYELAEPIEYILDTPFPATTQVNDMGTTLLLPENGEEPTTTPCNAEIVYGPNVQETLARLPQVYQSISDFKTTIGNLCTALGASLGKTIAVSWGGDNGSVGSFTITDNA